MVHDFTISAIALKRHFGDALKIGRPLDTQFALEALQGDIGGTIGSAIKVFTGTHDLFSDAAFRCDLIVLHAIDKTGKWERNKKWERTVFFRKQTNCVQLQEKTLTVLWGCTAAFE